MIYDSIAMYRVQLDPEGSRPNIDVTGRVDGLDIPDAQVTSVTMIFLGRAVRSLEELFGLEKSKVNTLCEELKQAVPYILRCSLCVAN